MTGACLARKVFLGPKLHTMMKTNVYNVMLLKLLSICIINHCHHKYQNMCQDYILEETSILLILVHPGVVHDTYISLKD